MSDSKQERCPYFADLPCPQGKESADACSVRVTGYFDPMLHIRDLQVMDCALRHSQRSRKSADPDIVNQ